MQSGALSENDRLYALLTEIAGKLDDVVTSHNETRDLLDKHMAEDDKHVDLMRKAFPGGDMEGHCAYHEEVIAQIKERREFWKKLTFELAKWGLIGFLGWMVIQIWHGALNGPKG